MRSLRAPGTAPRHRLRGRPGSRSRLTSTRCRCTLSMNRPPPHPALSPSGGEGGRRPGEGEPRQFKVSTPVRNRRSILPMNLPSAECGVRSRPRLRGEALSAHSSAGTVPDRAPCRPPRGTHGTREKRPRRSAYRSESLVGTRGIQRGSVVLRTTLLLASSNCSCRSSNTGGALLGHSRNWSRPVSLACTLLTTFEFNAR
jgi:hypothetical protein